MKVNAEKEGDDIAKVREQIKKGMKKINEHYFKDKDMRSDFSDVPQYGILAFSTYLGHFPDKTDKRAHELVLCNVYAPIDANRLRFGCQLTAGHLYEKDSINFIFKSLKMGDEIFQEFKNNLSYLFEKEPKNEI